LFAKNKNLKINKMRHFNLKIGFIALILGVSTTIFAQTPTLHNPNNTFINSRVEENNAMGLLWWKCDSMSPFQLFTTYKAHTGMTINDSMAVVRQWDDPQVCLQHVLYQHYYKGILVESSEFREHYDPAVNKVVLSNGRYVENLELSNIPAVTEAAALSNALAHINAESYAWQDDSMEYYLQLDSVPEMQSYYPQGELVYALVGDGSIVPANYKLAWKFRIFAISPHYDSYVYVDAMTGLIIKEYEEKCNGNFNHIYYGNQYLDTRWYGGLRQKHFLEANDNGRNIKTKDDNNFNGWGLSKLPDDKDDNRGNSRWGATSCHHVVQESWAMFKNTYSRNGFNNANKEIRVLGNDANNPNNAFYSFQNSSFDHMSFGSTSQGNLLATYDIGGHEFTHGVSRHTANFNRTGDAGALNESFSDIFGLMTERFAKGGSFNWTMGEDANFTIRNMQQPSTIFNTAQGMPHPDWHLQPGHWFNGTAVYHNAGVQNRYFYLLSMGGTQLGKWVQGVGVDIAANVSYYSLTNLTGSAETYPQAREHAVAAARILYGRCSYVENQVCRAWSACNIGPYCEPCEIITPCWTYGCGNSQSPMMGIEDLNNRTSKINIYPNPATDVLNIKFNELTNYEIENANLKITIIDMMGRTHLSRTLTNDDFENGLSISNLPTGVYSIFVSNDNGFNQSLKFVKQ
jgi:Zn-dependent metalloprotease